MKTTEKKCPVCRKSVEKLVKLYGGVFISPCMHPVIRVQSPIERALRTTLLLNKLQVKNDATTES